MILLDGTVSPASNDVLKPRIFGILNDLSRLITYSGDVLRDSLGMSLRQRLNGHRVLLMDVIPLRASQCVTGGIRQRGYSTFVGFVADARQFRDARQGLISLLLIMLRRLMQIYRGLPHLRRVPERKRGFESAKSARVCFAILLSLLSFFSTRV